MALTCAAQDPVELQLVQWASNLGGAVDITHCGDDRLFVLRQWGAITIVPDSMVNLSPAFLDITSQVFYSGERGMLGLAFDPNYTTNGFFYVNYVANVGQYGTTRISRFSRHATNPNLGDPTNGLSGGIEYVLSASGLMRRMLPKRSVGSWPVLLGSLAPPPSPNAAYK